MMSRRRGILVAALCGLLICLVIALAGGVETVQFTPGRILATEGAGQTTFQEWRGEPGTTSVIPGFDPFKILLPVCLALLVLSTALSIRDRKIRSELLISLLFFAAVVLATNLASTFHSDQVEGTVEQEEETATDSAPRDAGTVTTRVEQGPPMVPSGWPIIVSSVLAAALIGLVATPLVTGWLRRRRSPRSDSSAREILDIAADAAREIEAGEDPVGVVQRCYARMLRVLSDRAGVDPTYRTPREFATSLRDVGFGGESVDALTEMFELVRYGARSDSLFADRAYGHLNALRLSHHAG
jgi:hypothetical protein